MLPELIVVSRVLLLVCAVPALFFSLVAVAHLSDQRRWLWWLFLGGSIYLTATFLDSTYWLIQRLSMMGLVDLSWAAASAEESQTSWSLLGINLGFTASAYLLFLIGWSIKHRKSPKDLPPMFANAALIGGVLLVTGAAILSLLVR